MRDGWLSVGNVKIKNKKWWQSSTLHVHMMYWLLKIMWLTFTTETPQANFHFMYTDFLRIVAPSRLPTSTHHHKAKFIDFHDPPFVRNKHTVYTVFGNIWFLGRVPSVGVVHDGLHVVPGKQTRDAVAHSLEPAVVVLLDDVDDGSFHERQLVVLILDVVVDGNHCKDERY